MAAAWPRCAGATLHLLHLGVLRNLYVLDAGQDGRREGRLRLLTMFRSFGRVVRFGVRSPQRTQGNIQCLRSSCPSRLRKNGSR